MSHDTTDHHEEEIHMPPPSAAPIIVSAGATFLLIGVVNAPFLLLGLGFIAAGAGIWAFGPK